MRKFALGIGLSMGLIAVSTSVNAQGYSDEKADRRFYVSPMATYSLFDDGREFDDEIGYQLSLGKIVGRGTNIELHGNFAEPSSALAGGSDAELLSYGITFLLFQWRQDLPIYGILSVSKGEAKSANGNDKAKSDQFDVGLGYMLGLGSWPLIGNGPAIRFEARYRTDKYSAGEAVTYGNLFNGSDSRTYHDGVFGVGLFLPFGADPNAVEETEAPVEPSSRVVISQPDSDGDQIPDDMDACPGTAPGVTINAQGCEHDTDKDGIPNSKDNCPGTQLGVAVDAKGCPPDGDGDGVINTKDQCPSTPKGLAVLADGCALRGDCRIPGAGQRIDADGCAVGAIILKGVNFENGSADLTAPAKAVLDSVAKILAGASEVRIEVSGHTDSIGDAQYNLKLSQLRANSVKNYLVSKGVTSLALVPKGHGEAQPLVSNETAAGRERNRRVELKVLN
ncbi:MAG: OmpA family protein [Oceanococcus sp.]